MSHNDSMLMQVFCQVFGFPAEVKTIFTPSSITILMGSSVFGIHQRNVYSKSLSVAALHFCMCSCVGRPGMHGACSISPSPPALFSAGQSPAATPYHSPCMMDGLFQKIANSVHM